MFIFFCYQLAPGRQGAFAQRLVTGLKTAATSTQNDRLLLFSNRTDLQYNHLFGVSVQFSSVIACALASAVVFALISALSLSLSLSLALALSVGRWL